MAFKFPKIPAVLVPLLLAVFFVCCSNIVLLRDIVAAIKVAPVRIGFVLSIPIMLLAAFNIIFLTFSARWMLKPFFVVLLLLSAGVTYGMYAYGIVFDKNMIMNFAYTQPGEAMSYVSPSAALWVMLLGILPAAILIAMDIRYPSFWRSIGQKAASAGISALLLGLIAAFYFQDYASFIRNNSILHKEIVPIYAIGSVVRYAKSNLAKALPHREQGLEAVQEDADIGEKKELVVLIVGETQRSMNYEYNGYNRPTNPFTKELGVIGFADATSCGTATAMSVPCMFSNLTKKNYKKELADSQDNLLDVAKRTGVYVLWLDNDIGCKGVCDRVESSDLREVYKGDKVRCVGDGCHDTIFLDELEKRFDAIPDQTSLIVLHIMGAHGPTYFNRYPADQRFFKPDCQRSDIQNCTHDELVNSYDNAIRYNDFVMAKLITFLKKKSAVRNSAVIFMSDHGESLGEKGVYLHGLPYAIAPAEQTHVPFLLWMTDAFAADRGLDLSCVRKTLTPNHYSHDNLFHTTLGLLAVKAAEYKSGMDVLSPCRTMPPDLERAHRRE